MEMCRQRSGMIEAISRSIFPEVPLSFSRPSFFTVMILTTAVLRDLYLTSWNQISSCFYLCETRSGNETIGISKQWRLATGASEKILMKP